MPTATEVFIPSVLLPYLQLPVQQVEISQILGSVDRRYRGECRSAKEIQTCVKEAAQDPILVCKLDKAGQDKYKIVDGQKRFDIATTAFLLKARSARELDEQLEALRSGGLHSVINVRVLDLTVEEAKESMEAADFEDCAFYALGPKAPLISDEQSQPLRIGHFALGVAKRMARGRIGYANVDGLEKLLAGPTEDWHEQELYSGKAVWHTLDGVRWWLETLYDVLQTSAAMTGIDPMKGESHPLQAELLVESQRVFALSVPAIEEQVSLGYALFSNLPGADDVRTDFPQTVALMRAYRAFACHVADAVCTIFPEIERTQLARVI